MLTTMRILTERTLTTRKPAEASARRGARRKARAAFFPLLLACVGGCQVAVTSPTESPSPTAAASPIVQNTQRAEDERLLTPQQIGRARLGMSVREVKQLFPAADFALVTLPDIPSIVAVKQRGGEELLYFATEGMGDARAMPRDDERVSQLVTKSPQFRTAAGVGPSSPLEDAAKAYGAVTLYYSPDVEYAKFGAAEEFGFWVKPPLGQKSAGIYDAAAGESSDGFARTTRFRPGSKISYVSISEDAREARGSDAADAPGLPQRAASQVAAPFRTLITKIKAGTKVPVLLPGELPSTLSKQTLYASGDAKPDGYDISLSSRPRCGANSCFVGSFEAHRGEQPAFDRRVQLADDVTGYYQPLSCGGSCSPPIIEWVSGGVLYHIQLDVQWRAKLTEEEEQRLMVEVANSAIKAGAR